MAAFISGDTGPAATKVAALAAVFSRDFRSTCFAMARTTQGLKGLEEAFVRRAEEFEDGIKLGRTHLQVAVPMTPGAGGEGIASVCIDHVNGLDYTLFHMEFYQNLLFTGVVLSLILSVLFFIRKKKNRGNIYFSAYLLVISLFFILSIASTRRIDISPAFVLLLSNLTCVLLLLSGPALFFYLKASAYGVDPGSKTFRLLLFPAAAVFLYSVLRLPLSLTTAMPGLEDSYLQSFILFSASYLFMVFCYLKTLFLFRRYHRELKEKYSDFHRKRLIWFGILISFILLITGVDIASRVVERFYPRFQYNYQIIDILEILFIVGISFFALLQPELLLAPEEDKGGDREKYGKSSLTDAEFVKYRHKLKAHMETHKPYLEELSLPALAEALDMSVHTLSQVINKGNDRNFYYFINKYRVNEVIRLMNDEEKKYRTLLDLSLEAGFNSKSVFYHFFKLETGETPSRYRKREK